jgi:hypothetical protein
MSRDDEKHRGPEYVPAGPVRIRTTSMVEPDSAEARIAALEAALANALIQLGVVGAQIASLQMSMPKGIDRP